MKLPKTQPPRKNSKSVPAIPSRNSRSARQPAPPTSPLSPAEKPKQLELLNDEQLKKLTRQNTRKNHGGRKHRFRSQIERVCRRLDNFAVDAKLQQPTALEALPVVNPDASCASDSSDDGAKSKMQSSNNLQCVATTSDDNSDFEPTTSHSAFSNGSNASSDELQFKSVRSVRISTAVTVLDYDSTSQKDKDPVSISTLQRLEHPTRLHSPAMKRLEQDLIPFPKHGHARAHSRSSLSLHKSDEAGPTEEMPLNGDAATASEYPHDVLKAPRSNSYSHWTRNPYGPFRGNPYRQTAACYYGADGDVDDHTLAPVNDGNDSSAV